MHIKHIRDSWRAGSTGAGPVSLWGGDAMKLLVAHSCSLLVQHSLWVGDGEGVELGEARIWPRTEGGQQPLPLDLILPPRLGSVTKAFLHFGCSNSFTQDTLQTC